MTSTKLTTVEQLREKRENKTPLFRVVFLPFLEGLDPDTKEPFPTPRGYGYGFQEDIYTDYDEALIRYERLSQVGGKDIEPETLELWEVVYYCGSRANKILYPKKDLMYEIGKSLDR